MAKRQLLIIDDDLDLGFLLKGLFDGEGFDCETALKGIEGLRLFEEKKHPVVLCDFRLPDLEGLDLLKRLKEINQSSQVIIITGYSDVRIAVEAIKFGAFDYVTKPIIPDDIVEKVNAALEKADRKIEPETTKPAAAAKAAPKKAAAKEPEGYFIGKSKAFQKMLKHINLVAPTQMSVILEGETGVGKEVAARLLHDASPRAQNPFVAIDCGALPENLVASELFGHVKGAFTGATRDKNGYFMQANKGTLFLDEIGNLPYDVQVQLLRAVQERVIRRVGEETTHKIDIRLIVATNESLVDKVLRSEFREDLFHRLNEFKIQVPPLRDRGEDIMGFANYFLQRSNARLGKQIEGFAPDASELMENYQWPGNLREMSNVIQRSVLLCEHPHIQLRNLPDEMKFQSMGNQGGGGAYRPTLGANGPLASPTVPTHYGQEEPPTDLKSVSQGAEQEVIMRALRRNNFNRSRTAKELRIDRKTLYNKLKAYGIKI